MSFESDAKEYVRLCFTLSKLKSSDENYDKVKKRANALEKNLRSKAGKETFDTVIKPLVDLYFRKGR